MSEGEPDGRAWLAVKEGFTPPSLCDIAHQPIAGVTV
jgi:hypothetical protein